MQRGMRPCQRQHDSLLENLVVKRYADKSPFGVYSGVANFKGVLCYVCILSAKSQLYVASVGFVLISQSLNICDSY